MPEDLKLSQIGSSQPPPPFRGLHSPGVKEIVKLSLPVISGNRLLRTLNSHQTVHIYSTFSTEAASSFVNMSPPTRKRPLVQMQDLWHIARWHLLTLWWTHFCTECRVHVNCIRGFGGRGGGGGWGGAFKESRGGGLGWGGGGGASDIKRTHSGQDSTTRTVKKADYCTIYQASCCSCSEKIIICISFKFREKTKTWPKNQRIVKSVLHGGKGKRNSIMRYGMNTYVRQHGTCYCQCQQCYT